MSLAQYDTVDFNGISGIGFCQICALTYVSYNKLYTITHHFYLVSIIMMAPLLLVIVIAENKVHSNNHRQAINEHSAKFSMKVMTVTSRPLVTRDSVNVFTSD